MNTWVKEPDGIEAARRIVTAEIPALQALVGHELLEHGYNYTYKVELGIVPFPTKMYGNRVYPAGNYEALRITLGSGLGQNWWCVLFPPLCFMDAISGEAVAKDEPTTDVQLGKAANLQSKDNSDSSNYTQASPDLTHASIQIHSKAQIHFFVWDKSKLLYSWVKHKL
jgi:stage II sporulation protein R